MSTQDEFEYSGVNYVAIEANGCGTCSFHYRKNACRAPIVVPPCRKEERRDNRSVVFVKKVEV